MWRIRNGKTPQKPLFLGHNIVTPLFFLELIDMSHKILRQPEVLAKMGVKETWLKKMVRAGTFPAPIKMGDSEGCSIGWLESEVDAWIDHRIAERDATVVGGAE